MKRENVMYADDQVMVDGGATVQIVDTVTDAVRRLARAHGLNDQDAEDCAKAFWTCRCCLRVSARMCERNGVQDRPASRALEWYVRQWVRDRTVWVKEMTPDGERLVLCNVDPEAIVRVVSTLTPSSQWLWRRVEVDGVKLKDLAEEVGVTATDLNRHLSEVWRRIRRAINAEGDANADRETGRRGDRE